MRINLLVIIFFLLGITYNSFAQKKSETKKICAKARKLYENGEWQEAAKVFLKADSLEPKDPFINYSIGMCYGQSNEYYKSLPYFATAKEKGNLSPDLDYHYGKALHQNNKFNEAIVAFESYRPKLHHSDNRVKELERLIEYCKNGEELIKNLWK